MLKRSEKNGALQNLTVIGVKLQFTLLTWATMLVMKLIDLDDPR